MLHTQLYLDGFKHGALDSKYAMISSFTMEARMEDFRLQPYCLGYYHAVMLARQEGIQASLDYAQSIGAIIPNPHALRRAEEWYHSCGSRTVRMPSNLGPMKGLSHG